MESPDCPVPPYERFQVSMLRLRTAAIGCTIAVLLLTAISCLRQYSLVLGRCEIRAVAGLVSVVVFEVPPGFPVASSVRVTTWPRLALQRQSVLIVAPDGRYIRAWSVSVPLYVAAILPWIWCALRYMRAVRPAHLCTCGYNLTGNESGKCPECGRRAGPRSTAHGSK